MGHPAIENKTPFAFEPLHLFDDEGHQVLTTVIKGTFVIGADGRCARAEQQEAVTPTGELWGEDPETSSYRYEPEVAFTKPATDVVLLGHAVAPRAGATEVTVALRAGSLQQQAIVFGERAWFKSLGQVSASKPRPFEKIPLVWERAFGGWDRSHADPARHVCEARNPVGRGARPSKSFEEGLRLPNIEDPQQPLRRFGDAPAPVGFGFVSPHWQPRAALAGSFDERWQQERAPLLPRNFDRRHLNAAAPGLTAAGYLRGDEAIAAVGVQAQGALRFALPGLPPPRVEISFREGEDQAVTTNLDTVIIDADQRRVLLLWRACVKLPSGTQSLESVTVTGA
jgi:hypothetical protein